jgi:D-glycero-D-manno-heptose 1,7-bisphosphate phosphatase
MPPKTGRPCVFLDRDGILNEAVVRQGRPYPPSSVEELRILPGVPESCAHLSGAGFALVVVTNQPDVARGTTDLAQVDEIHASLRHQVSIDAVYLCPHDDADGCGCRKPRPGLLMQAATDLDLDLAQSYMVGDRWRDIEAGQQAGCRTVFVDRGYDEKRPVAPDAIVASLPDAEAWIMTDSAKVLSAS